MKTKCTFYTEQVKDSENKYRVYFSKRQRRNDVQCYEVTVKNECKNKKVVAELHVIRHVLIDSGIFSDVSSLMISLQVSCGAIRKILNNASQSKIEYAYARFLNTKLPGIDILVKHQRELAEKFDSSTILELSVLKPPVDIENVTSIGKVKVTEHAIKRFQQRFTAEKTLAEAFQMLKKKINSTEIKRVDLCKESNARCIVRHKKMAEYYILNRYCFVTVPEDGYKSLVTVVPSR